MKSNREDELFARFADSLARIERKQMPLECGRECTCIQCEKAARKSRAIQAKANRAIREELFAKCEKLFSQ